MSSSLSSKILRSSLLYLCVRYLILWVSYHPTIQYLFNVSYSSPQHTPFTPWRTYSQIPLYPTPINIPHDISINLEAQHPGLLALWPSHLQSLLPPLPFQLPTLMAIPQTWSICSCSTHEMWNSYITLSDHKYIHPAFIHYTCSLPSKSLDPTFNLFTYSWLPFLPILDSSIPHFYHSLTDILNSLAPLLFHYPHLQIPTLVQLHNNAPLDMAGEKSPIGLVPQ